MKQKITSDIIPAVPVAMGNYFLLNEKDGWAAVCISKNGCTSLKERTLQSSGHSFNEDSPVHVMIGFTEYSPFLTPVTEPPKDLFCFAIWRDPVKRLVSIYQAFGLDRHTHRRYADKVNQGFDQWIDFAAQEHKKPIERQDEHVRHQSDYYDPSQVDTIVDLSDLDQFFKKQGWPALHRSNLSHARFTPSLRQIRRIERLYQRDYMLRKSLTEF